MPTGHIHTVKSYEAELNDLRSRLIRMATDVESMVSDSIKAICNKDVTLAQTVIDRDPAIDRAELEFDHRCLSVLARRQPLAGDLRFLSLALKMVSDVERIGDLAVNIAERALELSGSQAVQIPDRLYDMAMRSCELLSDAFDAFARNDADVARRVRAKDDAVDDDYHALVTLLLSVMKDRPECQQECVHLLSVAKWVERIGDHATSISELVVYVEEGDDIRHKGLGLEIDARSGT